MNELQKVVDGLDEGGARMYVTTSYNVGETGPRRIDVTKDDPEATYLFPELRERKIGPKTNAHVLITQQSDEQRKRDKSVWGDHPIAIEVYYGSNGSRDGHKVWNDVMSVDDTVAFVLSDLPNLEKLSKMKAERHERWDEQRAK